MKAHKGNTYFDKLFFFRLHHLYT